MPKLTTHVHVVERDDKGNTTRAQTFGPSDDVPDWAVAAITNPDVWDGDPPSRTATAAQQVTGLLPMPPKAGPGSGVDAWRAYAQQEKVTVPDGAGRDEIVAAIEAARS